MWNEWECVQVSASTLLAVADVLDLFNAFGVPCSAGTAQRLLVEAVNHAQQVNLQG